jgi:hypothetical protein
MVIPWIPATAWTLIRNYGIILSTHSGFSILGRSAKVIIILLAAGLGKDCSGGVALLSFGEGWGKAPFPGAGGLEPGYYLSGVLSAHFMQPVDLGVVPEKSHIAADAQK